MRAKKAFQFVRQNPLFPVIPFAPIALFIGSIVLSALALREARHLRRDLAPVPA